MSLGSIIVDIDGTLANISHRLHHISGSNRNWDTFFAACAADDPFADIGDLTSDLATNNEIILVSGRPERSRGDTEGWLQRHGIPYSALYMRPDGDYRADTIIKSQILDHLISQGKEIRLVIDDRPSVVAMWRDRGLTCLQCRDWDEMHHQVPLGLLTLMVGPSGAGKTTWLNSDAARDMGIHPSHVLSSDQFRADLCGDFRDQSQNDRVFQAVHAVAKERLKHGLPTVIDATNIRHRDRIACVALANGSAIRYILIDRPMDQKLRDAGWRSGVTAKGKPLIEQHAQTFGSQLAGILKGDSLPNVTVHDMRVL